MMKMVITLLLLLSVNLAQPDIDQPDIAQPPGGPPQSGGHQPGGPQYKPAKPWDEINADAAASYAAAQAFQNLPSCRYRIGKEQNSNECRCGQTKCDKGKYCLLRSNTCSSSRERGEYMDASETEIGDVAAASDVNVRSIPFVDYALCILFGVAIGYGVRGNFKKEEQAMPLL